MEPDQEKFETWLYSAQPVCKAPRVCWEAGLEADEGTRMLVGTTQSEDAFDAWHKGVMAKDNDLRLFDAYCAAISWGRQYVGVSSAIQDSNETSTGLDTIRPLRI